MSTPAPTPQDVAEATLMLTQQPTTPRTTIDHTVYPHIVDTILTFAPVASLVILRQTCRALRERSRPLLFEHVIFLPDESSSALHVLTAAPPYLYLASIALTTNRDYGPDVLGIDIRQATIPPELEYTRTLDLYYSTSTLDLGCLEMPALHVIRRVYDDYEPMFEDRRLYFYILPAADIVVDRLDSHRKKMAFPTVCSTDRASSHFVHLAFDNDNPWFAQAGFLGLGQVNRRTIILHPRAGTGQEYRRQEPDPNAQVGTSSSQLDVAVPDSPPFVPPPFFTELCDMLEARVGYRTIIVGLERLRPGMVDAEWAERAAQAWSDKAADQVDHLDSGTGTTTSLRLEGDGSQRKEVNTAEEQDIDATDNSGETDDTPVSTPTLKFETYDSWMARYAGRPESMTEYYESAKMRRSRTAWEEKITSGQ